MIHQKSLGRKTSEKSTSSRSAFSLRYIVVVLLAIGIFVAGLIIQMYRWQVLSYERFSQMAKTLHVQDARLPTSRGTIYSEDGSVLAVDKAVWGVYASISSDPNDRERFEEQRDKFIEDVSSILSVSKDELDNNLTDEFLFVPIKHYVSPEDKLKLEEADLFGLYFIQEEKRLYPNGSLASQVLGFVGKDSEGNDVGMYGLEGYYAGDLLGQEGFQYEEKDSRGNVIMTGEYDPVLPRQGKNLVLTIRSGLQAKVEALIKKGVEDHGAKSGSVVIMDPNTGAILAMANYPTYDPNYYWKEKDLSVYRNRAVSDVYEYGSVNKAVTVSAALQEGTITPEWICTDDTGSIEVLDKTIYTWDKNPDWDQQPKDVLKNSNNVCAVKIGQTVGIEKYYEYLQMFGIGDFIGIGLQDEATSYLKPLAEWNEVDLAAASFGQMISATPLQVTSAISTIANDGTRMRPYIVESLYDEDERIDVSPEIAAQPISPEVAYQVQDMLEVVVREGEVKNWFNKLLPNYTIAGKTGTAQVPLPNAAGYYDDKTNATFVAFSPVHGAKMIMLVRLEEPADYFSASSAAPVWIEIFQNVSMDLGIAPDRVP